MRDLFSGMELYHILEEVGQGTFGKVARCWRSCDGELVAIKMMKLEPHRNKVIRNELKIIGALSRVDLSHSHIVQFFEAFSDQTHQYLVFEMLEKSVYQLQREAGFRPMAVRHIRVIACQMLKALQKLEEISVIHADLKPENIMLVDHGRFPFRVKLIDFGSSSILNEVRFVKEPYIQSRFYRSPEILLGLPFCEKVDMWSLGCVMSELYLSWPLYPGESEMEQVRYICETQGLPHRSLLNSASKAHMFFTLTKSSQGESQWQLKSSRMCSASGEEGRGGKKNGGGRRDKRKYIFSSLDQLACLELTRHDSELRNEDIAAEETDRHIMVDLLKMILTLDAQKRIVPSDALRHPFITTGHLSSYPEFSRYHQASKLAMQQAGVWNEAPVGNTSTQCQHLPPREDKDRHQPRPQGLLTPPQQHKGEENTELKLELRSQRLSESPGEQALTEQVQELSTTDSAAGQETFTGSGIEEDGHCTSQPSSIKAKTSNCNLKASDVGTDASEPPNYTDRSPYHHFQIPTVTYPSKVTQVKTTLDHHQWRFQHPQYHPGESSSLCSQTESLFLGHPYSQNSLSHTLHHSYRSRMSESQRLHHQLAARSSCSDPYQYSLGRMPGGVRGAESSLLQPPASSSTREVLNTSTHCQPKRKPQPWVQLHTEAQTQSCPEPLTRHSPEAEAEADPQHLSPDTHDSSPPESDSQADPEYKHQAGPAEGLHSDMDVSTGQINTV